MGRFDRVRQRASREAGQERQRKDTEAKQQFRTSLLATEGFVLSASHAHVRKE